MTRRRGSTATGRHDQGVPNPNTPRLYSTVPRGHTVFNPPLVSDPNDPPPPCGLDVSGKIGQTVFQRTIPWIAQGVKGPGLVTQIRRHVIPYDPRTTAQLLNRARFAAAVAAWRHLTAAQQSAYNDRASRLEPPVDGRNLWIREYAKAHPPSEFGLQAELLRVRGQAAPEGPGP
jgi:hypothetical protein